MILVKNEQQPVNQIVGLLEASYSIIKINANFNNRQQLYFNAIPLLHALNASPDLSSNLHPLLPKHP